MLVLQLEINTAVFYALVGCVTLGTLLNLSEFQFHHLPNR